MIENLNGLETPRAGSARLPSMGSRRLVDVVSISSAPQTDVDIDTEAEEQRLDHEESVREMERRADEFYRTGLMGRCWDTWVQSHDWIKVCRNEQGIDSADLSDHHSPDRCDPPNHHPPPSHPPLAKPTHPRAQSPWHCRVPSFCPSTSEGSATMVSPAKEAHARASVGAVD